MDLSSIFASLSCPMLASRPVVPRGGWRQRAAASNAASTTHDKKTSFTSRCKSAEEHLKGWSEGYSSAMRHARHSRGNVADGWQHPATLRLDDILKGGMHHAQEKLLETMSSLGLGKLVTAVDGEGCFNDVIMPSHLLQHILRRPTVFHRVTGASVPRLQAFWSQLFSSIDCKELHRLHPLLRGHFPADLATSIPIVVHEDAGPYSKRRSCDIIDYSSVRGEGKEIETKWVFGTFIKGKNHSDDESMMGWVLFLSDMTRLRVGYDEDGSPLLHDPLLGIDWKLILLFEKGDMEVECRSWGLTAWDGADEMCSSCLANRTDKPYTDNKEDSKWRPTSPLLNMQFRERCKHMHALTQSLYFNRHFVRCDGMHVVDHNGLACIIHGSVLKLLVQSERQLGRTQDKRLDHINVLRGRWYESHIVSSRIPSLEMQNSSHKGGWSVLKGSIIKSAATRKLSPFIETLALKYFDGPSDLHESVREVTMNLNKYYHIVYESEMFMTDRQLLDMNDAINTLGWHMQRLRVLCHQQGWLHFQFTQKCHYLMDMWEQSSLINVRFTKNYCAESLVGRIAKMWHSATRGPYQKRIQATVLCKYLVLLSLTLGL